MNFISQHNHKWSKVAKRGSLLAIMISIGAISGCKPVQITSPEENYTGPIGSFSLNETGNGNIDTWRMLLDGNEIVPVTAWTGNVVDHSLNACQSPSLDENHVLRVEVKIKPSKLFVGNSDQIQFKCPKLTIQFGRAIVPETAESGSTPPRSSSSGATGGVPLNPPSLGIGIAHDFVISFGQNAPVPINYRLMSNSLNVTIVPSAGTIAAGDRSADFTVTANAIGLVEISANADHVLSDKLTINFNN